MSAASLSAGGADEAAAAAAARPSRPPRAARAAEDESDRFYQGLLTNEDLAADPPDHRSGYVAIIGRPNAGKSTLLNALLGQKLSIVSHKAQTTRHRILGILSAPQHQAILMDTPGVVDERRNRLEGRMMAFVKTAMRDADAIIAIVDSQRRPEDVLDMVQPPPNYDGPPMLVVLNKQDLIEPDRAAELEEWWRTNCRCDAVVCTSALEKRGVDAVKEWIVSKLPAGPTLYPKKLVSEHPERFFVSEIIREHVFHQYSEEVPYCVQVNVKEFKERKRGKHYVSCELVCEKDSQKGILLGSKGTAIKALSTAARVDIEEFLGHPVYLEMKVRLDKGWRSDADKLKRFGY